MEATVSGHFSSACGNPGSEGIVKYIYSNIIWYNNGVELNIFQCAYIYIYLYLYILIETENSK